MVVMMMMMMTTASWNDKAAAVVTAAFVAPTTAIVSARRRILTGSVLPQLHIARCLHDVSTIAGFPPTPSTTSYARTNGFCTRMSTIYNERKRPRSQCFASTSSMSNNKGHRDLSRNVDDSSPRISCIVQTRMLETLVQEILPAGLSANNININTTIPTTNVVLVLGVSGGCDSVALLHALWKECQRQHQDGPTSSLSISLNKMQQQSQNKQQRQQEQFIQCPLHVIHFDHQQRGIDSDGDREFVQKLCNKYNIPLQIHYWNEREQQQRQQQQRQNQQEQSLFSQEEARNWRRRLMREYLDALINKQQYTETSLNDDSNDSKQNAVTGILLTAHHQDDSDETLLLKVLRGAHLTNWRGLNVTTQDEDGYIWARPLIHLRKQDLINYLVHHNVSWREDASNLSDKYRRNRVRNELLPLLEDLCGGADSLRKRFDFIQEQSNEMHQDLDERAREYLNQSRSTKQYFVLPPQNKFVLVHKEALHVWVMDQIGDNFQFTYEQLQRVCQQITEYPENRQWRLNIGECYDIQRNGGHLQLIQHNINATSDRCSADSTSMRRNLQYSIVDEETIAVDESALDGNASDDESIIVAIPKDLLGSAVIESNAGECSAMMITPPWRESPLKVKDLLRGQKVPLEDRALARVIMMEQPNVDGVNQAHIVAVFVTHKDQWIVNKAFSPDGSSKEKSDSSIQCSIDLRKSYPKHDSF